MNKKSVLILASTFPTFLENDVTPRFVHEIAKQLTKNFNVIVSTPHIPRSKDFETQDGVRIYRYRYFPERFEHLANGAMLPNIKKNFLQLLQLPFLLCSGFFAIAKLVRQENVNLIWSIWIIPQGFLSTIYISLINRKMKQVCTAMGVDLFSLNFFPFRQLKKWIISRSAGFSVLSTGMKLKVEELSLSKTPKIIPLGVTMTEFSMENHGAIRQKYNISGPLLLFVGRFAEKKGVKYALAAFVHVVQKRPDAKFLIVGSGPLEQQLKEQTKDLGLSDHVIFTGGIPNDQLPAFYADADVFVGPSITTQDGDSEGLGVVFIEALAAKCAVVTSRLPAIADTIIHEKTGLTVEVKDDRELADALLLLINDKNLSERLANQGYNHVKDAFEWTNVGKRYVQFLNDHI